MQLLSEKISALVTSGEISIKLPEVIGENIRAGFGKRTYQIEAFARFKYYIDKESPSEMPTQLLFHMATGSGKTLIMAGCILYLYEKGYRNFIFFVNSTNIIDKTRDNFLNPASSKYLFNTPISINGKQVSIREVQNFENSQTDNINIIFTTIQGLHTRLRNSRENAITYADLSDKNLVLISDEAHHINAETKKGNAIFLEEAISWESTVNKILETNSENILLEFTATADLKHDEIRKKYTDKLIFDYSLRQFRLDGFSKEVKVLQTNTSEIERALVALVLSQYRRKLFEKYGQAIKPVILFKSKTIKESRHFFEVFEEAIAQLSSATIEKWSDNNEHPVLKKAFSYFSEQHVDLENLVLELKNDFAREKCIIVNSKDETEIHQIALNTLEDVGNEYRAIFAVDKLNEGWDVLNLFDIVRLYNTRDVQSGKVGKTTMSEAQLIGRGARYCPFKIREEQSAYTRKYDGNHDHELRICEELYYHSAYNPPYLEDLDTALKDIGIKAEENEIAFEDYQANPKNYIDSDKKKPLKNLQTLNLPQLIIYKTQATEVNKPVDAAMISTFTALGIPVILKAISKLCFFQFSSLKNYFVQLQSISEFINSPEYLGNIKIRIEGINGNVDVINPEEKLKAAMYVLSLISQKILAHNH